MEDARRANLEKGRYDELIRELDSVIAQYERPETQDRGQLYQSPAQAEPRQLQGAHPTRRRSTSSSSSPPRIPAPPACWDQP